MAASNADQTLEGENPAKLKLWYPIQSNQMMLMRQTFLAQQKLEKDSAFNATLLLDYTIRIDFVCGGYFIFTFYYFYTK